MADNSEQIHVIKITADTSEIDPALEKSERELTAMEKLVKHIGGSFSNMGKRISDSLKFQNIDRASKKIENLSNNFKDFDMKHIQSEIDKTQRRLDMLSERGSKMQFFSNTSKRAWESLQYDIDLSKSKLESLNAAMSEKLEQSIANVSTKMQEMMTAKVPTEDYIRMREEAEKAGQALEKLLNKQELLELSRSGKDVSEQLKVIQDAADISRDRIAALQHQLSLIGDTSSPAYRQIANDIKSEERNLSSLMSQIQDFESANSGVDSHSEAWNKLQKEIEIASEKYDRYESAIADMEKSGKAYRKGIYTDDYANAMSELRRYQNGLKSVQQSNDKYLTDTHTKYSGVFKNIIKESKKVGTTIFKSIGGAFKSTIGVVGKGAKTFALSKIFAGLDKKSNSVSSLVSEMTHSLTSFFTALKSSLAQKAVTTTFNDATDNFNELATVSIRFNEAVSNIIDSLNALGTQAVIAIEPIVTVVAPIISFLADKLEEGADAVAQFIARVTGNESYFKATKGQSDYAASLEETTENTKEADKAAKKYKATILGFDEIHRLQSNTDNEEVSSIGIDGAAINKEMTKATALNELADRIKAAFDKGDWKTLGSSLAEGVNMAFSWVSKTVGWSQNVEKFSAVTQGFIDTLNGFVDGLDTVSIGQSIADVANTVINVFDMINDPKKGIQFKKIGQKIGTGLISTIKSINWNKAGRALANSVQNLVKGINGLLESTIEDETTGEVLSIGTVIGRALNDLFVGAIDAISPEEWGNAIANIINNLCDMIAVVFEDGQNVTRIVESITGTINQAFKKIDGDKVAAALSALSQTFVSAITTFFTTLDWGAIWDGLYSILTSNQLDWSAVLSALGIIALGSLLTTALSGGIANGIVGAVMAGLAIVTPMVMDLIDQIKQADEQVKSEAEKLKLSDYGAADFSNVSPWDTGNMAGAAVTEMLRERAASAGGKQAGEVVVASQVSKHTGKAIADANDDFVLFNETILTAQQYVENLKDGFLDVEGKSYAVTGQMQELSNHLIATGKAFSDTDTKLSNMSTQTDKSTQDLISSFSNTSDAVSNFGSKLDSVSSSMKQVDNDISSIIQTDYGDGGRSSSVKIAHYAQGGIVGDGQLFYANEGGVAELIGNDGRGNTAVVNNEQIIKAVVTGVKQGVTEAMMMTADRGSSQQQERGGDIVLRVDSEDLARAVNNGQNKINRRGNHTLAFV